MGSTNLVSDTTPTPVSIPLPIETSNFDSFLFPPMVNKAIKRMGFVTPTPIQELAIPHVLKGNDVLAQAPTGTGKTAAFGLPILTKLLASPNQVALVLAPTRELADQIIQVWREITYFNPELRCALLIGGMPMDKQIRDIRRGPRLVVATPGRLNDHLKRRTLTLRNCSILILDEADRMLDMGFEPQLRAILPHLPQIRQTMMFSATIPHQVERLANQYLRQPVRLSVKESVENIPKINQIIVETTFLRKEETLLKELQAREGSALVFTRTRISADRVARYLETKGLLVEKLHGGRSQNQRHGALKGIKDGRIDVLVATDIAARGIDIRQVTHVINYDLPQTTEDYIHRIGRTARAGASGEAISLVMPEERWQWKRIAKDLQRKNI
ncbi:MAG: DEAD/DEAH box helicase [Pseudomonadota bacterium]